MTEFMHDPTRHAYDITGLLYNNSTRFKLTTVSPRYALGINLWRGSVWQRDFTTGKRKLVKRVCN